MNASSRECVMLIREGVYRIQVEKREIRSRFEQQERSRRSVRDDSVIFHLHFMSFCKGVELVQTIASE